MKKACDLQRHSEKDFEAIHFIVFIVYQPKTKSQKAVKHGIKYFKMF